MSTRQSLYPTGGQPSSSAAIKQRQIHHLASRLQELSNRLEGLDRQVVVASQHAEMMRQLGGQHAALCVKMELCCHLATSLPRLIAHPFLTLPTRTSRFMAAARVMTEEPSQQQDQHGASKGATP